MRYAEAGNPPARDEPPSDCASGVTYYVMSASAKILDKRYTTRGGGRIRIEVWLDLGTKAVVRYNLAYVNPRITNRDSGRVIGLDNSHVYPGFQSSHHVH